MAEIRSPQEKRLARRSPRSEGWLAQDSLPRRVAPVLLGLFVLWLLVMALVIKAAHFAGVG